MCLRCEIIAQILLIIDDVDPVLQELIVHVALTSELGSGDDARPLTHDLHGHVGAVAVELQISLGLVLAVEGKEQVGGGNVGSRGALGSVCPVAHIELAVVADDDVGGVEVAVADLELLGHTVQTLLKVVTRGGIELIKAVDHAGELVALTVEQRGGVAVDLDLEVDEHLEVLTEALGLGSHLLGKGGARNLLGHERPAVGVLELGNLESLGAADAALVDAGKIQSLVEHVGDRLGLVKDLDDLVAQVVNDLVATADELGLGIG